MSIAIMEKVLLAIILPLLTASSVLCSSVLNGRRDDLIEDSVRRLLGFKPGISRDASPFSKNITLPPRYMMDLYEKYRSGQSPMQGNTVRSILPMRDNMGEADVLIFNLTGINSGERILQSELYILKRKRPRHGKKRDSSTFRMKIGTLPNMTFHRYIDITLPRQKSEWQSYDITNSVLHCRRSNQHSDSLLGITLEVKRSKNKYRLSPFRRLLKTNSQPFILIFSEDGQRHPSRTKPKSEFDAIQELINAKAQSDDIQSDDAFASSEESLASSEIRDKRSLHKFELKRFRNDSSMFSNIVSQTNMYINLSNDTLKTKSIKEHLGRTGLLHKKLSDKYSLNETLIPYTSAIEQNGAADFSSDSLFHNILKVLSIYTNVLLKNILSSENVINEINYDNRFVIKPKITKRSISNKLTNSKTFKDSPGTTANTLQAIDEKTFNVSSSSHRSQRRNRKGKRQRKKQRNRKLPFWWNKHDSKLHSKDYQNMCQRRSLVVDFAKLGWGDWVMSPKSFNAHYCTGGCSFPLLKNTNPSNHAALQSLMHALGLQSGIPTPCCVPSATSPLTLLYFDEHGSLVLKNYPDMIVRKCACR